MFRDLYCLKCNMNLRLLELAFKVLKVRGREYVIVVHERCAEPVSVRGESPDC